MARDESKRVIIGYEREGSVVAYRMVNVDDAEIRAYIAALWAILEPPSRIDMIRELAHYHESPHAVLPPVSQVIADAYRASVEKGER